MDDTARLEVAAEALFCVIWESDEAWELASDSQKLTTRGWAQTVIDALQLTPEKERRKRCVCRHSEVDHDPYGNGHCGANMVTRHTPCPCTGFVAQNRHRLVSPWVRSDA